MSLPHVTEILRDAGLVDTTWFTDEARDRGSAVHLAARYLDEGDLDRETLDPTVAPRLAQYERFLADARPEIHEIERRFEDAVYGYQGTPDRIVTINGLRGILDIKGPTRSDWHGVQLAAYARANRVGGRWNLYLHDNSYALIQRTSRNDWAVFLAALTLRNWRQECRNKS